MKIDTAEASALPGVKAVLTYESVPDWKTGIPRHVKVLDHKVRFVGDAVALVAAETEQRASEALEHIQVLYEQLPAVYDVEEALQPDAPQLYDEFPSNLVPLDVKVFGPKSLSKVVMGDVDKGFAEADFIGEGIYSYENVANPLPLEPPGVIAEWRGPDQLTVWSATQSASWHRFIMLSKMGFPDIRAISTHCGGSFGSKNYSAQPLFYAAALSKATGRPVKVMYNKEEHFGAFCLRLGSRFRGKVGIKRDGTVTAVSGEWLVDTGAFSDMAQAQVAVGCGEAQLMLRCTNWNLQTKLVLTNRCASGVVRGFGGQELESAFHPILSIAMEPANLDPVDFFRKNYVKPGEGYFWRDGNWWVCRGKDDWATEVEKRTNGQVKFTRFPGGALLKGPEIYDGVVRGIADVGMSVFAYTQGRFPSIEAIDLPAGYPTGVAASAIINDFYKKWESLPKDVQAVFEEVSKEWIKKTGEAWDESDREGREFSESLGNQTIKLSDQESARWAAAVEPVFEDYIKAVEPKGLPGRDYVNFIREEVKKYK